jgi:hypothetical protein
MSDEIPRRNQINRWTAAERLIDAAVQEVEAVGADVRLTDAVNLLQAARESVADYIDGIDGRRISPAVRIVPDGKVAGLACPFCRDDDFDAVGLKYHLTHGKCQAFERVESLGLQIGGQA